MNLTMHLTFRAGGFDWDGDGILTVALQSRSSIAVWTRKPEPLPLTTLPEAYVIALFKERTAS